MYVIQVGNRNRQSTYCIHTLMVHTFCLRSVGKETPRGGEPTMKLQTEQVPLIEIQVKTPSFQWNFPTVVIRNQTAVAYHI